MAPCRPQSSTHRSSLPFVASFICFGVLFSSCLPKAALTGINLASAHVAAIEKMNPLETLATHNLSSDNDYSLKQVI